VNANEKRVFIGELIGTVSQKAFDAVKDMPEEWDGHELRQLLADYFRHQVLERVMTGRRLKDYQNDMLVRNL